MAGRGRSRTHATRGLRAQGPAAAGRLLDQRRRILADAAIGEGERRMTSRTRNSMGPCTCAQAGDVRVHLIRGPAANGRPPLHEG